jgi:phenylacetate-CoA ligase
LLVGETVTVDRDVERLPPYYFQSVDWKRLLEDHPPPPIYERRIGSMSDDEMRHHQNRLFLKRVAEAWEIPFFQERWSAADIEPGDVRSLDDLDVLPIYNSDDLKASIAARPPFGLHQPIGREDFGRIPLKVQTSGGTTGLPRPTLFDPVAWEVQAIQIARGLWSEGARPGDIAQVPLTCALGNAAWCHYKACHDWLGIVPVTTGSGVVTPSEKQLAFAREFGVNIWIISAEYAGRLIEVATDEGFDLPSLRTKFLHAYIGIDPEGLTRKAIETAFEAPVFEGYGTHEVGEVAGECWHRDRMHVYEDTVMLQVLDVESHRAVPEGMPGSLVATSLHRSYPPIIRYDLRDRFALSGRQHCECGVTSPKLSQFQGRVDEMVKVRSTNVFPRAIGAILANEGRSNGQYLCVVTSAGKGVVKRSAMTVRIERADRGVDALRLEHDLRDKLKGALGVSVGVDIVDPGDLAEDTRYGDREGKVRRLLDLRYESD